MVADASESKGKQGMSFNRRIRSHWISLQSHQQLASIEKCTVLTLGTNWPSCSTLWTLKNQKQTHKKKLRPTLCCCCSLRGTVCCHGDHGHAGPNKATGNICIIATSAHKEVRVIAAAHISGKKELPEDAIIYIVYQL